MLKFGWLGFHQEGVSTLNYLIKTNSVSFVMTLDKKSKNSKSASSDYKKNENIPYYEINNINNLETISIIKRHNIDILFVIGWSQILSEKALKSVNIGVIGSHASLLPNLRGSAPVNWAIIKNLKKTGNTLMWLSNGVDSGRIIDQVEFAVTMADTCNTLYKKVEKSNFKMIKKFIINTNKKKMPLGNEQEKTNLPLLARRKPEDGEINWNLPAKDVYNLIRALTTPYPGAFSKIENKKIFVWKASYLDLNKINIGRPGYIVGKCQSTAKNELGWIVACKTDAIQLSECEIDSSVLKGLRLSKKNWKGKYFETNK
jgi:methionyl-tRNA formyltransferase